MAIFGYNTAGGTAEAISATDKRFCKFTTGSDMGTVTDIYAYLDRSAGGSGYVATAAIYTDNAGVPDALVANSVLEITSNIARNSPAWYSAAYSTAPVLSPNTTYWLGVLFTKASKSHYDAGSTNQQAENNDSLPFDDPFGTVGTYQDNEMSVYVVYTPEAGYTLDAAGGSFSIASPVETKVQYGRHIGAGVGSFALAAPVETKLQYDRIVVAYEFPATDDFNRANENPIASPWTKPSILNNSVKIVSNEITGISVTGDENGAFYTDLVLSPNQYAKLKLTTGDSHVGVLLRGDTSTHYCYYFGVRTGVGGYLLARVLGGPFYEFYYEDGTWASDGDTFEVQISDFQIKFIVNGTTVKIITDTDENLSNAGYAGVYCRSDLDVLDDFECGEISAYAIAGKDATLTRGKVLKAYETPATDDFNRADGDVGPNWSLNDTTATEPVISSNQLVHSGAAQREFIQYNVSQPNNDQYSKAKIVSVLDEWLLVRCQTPSTAENCYGVNIEPTNVDFYKWVGGVATKIGSQIADTVSANDIIEFRIVGYTLYYLRNGVLKGSVTDTSEEFASGYVGIGTYGTTGVWDDWEGGSLSAFGIAGQDVTLTRGKVLDAQPGSFVLTGSDADLIYTPASTYTLDAAGGTFAITGTAADLEYGRSLKAYESPESDDFNRANETPLADPWETNTGAAGGAVLYNNGVAGGTTSRCSVYKVSAKAFSPDQYCQFKLLVAPADLSVTVLVRGANDSRTFYELVLYKSGATSVWALKRNIAGSASQISGDQSYTFNVGDVFRLQAVGTGNAVSLQVWINGVSQGTWTDDSGDRILSGQPGVELYGMSATTAYLDDWEGGSVSAFGIAGRDVNLYKGKTLNAESGTFAITGTDADLEYGRHLGAASGAFALSGTDADLEFGRHLGAGAGSFALSGTDADLEYGRHLGAGIGSFVLTGTAADLEYGRHVVAGLGTFDLTGTDASLYKGRTLNAESGSFALTGTAADLEYGRHLGAGAGSFSVTGTAADLEYGRHLGAGVGAFVLTGTAADIEYGRHVVAGVGAYVLTGTAADLIWSGGAKVLTADPGSFAISGTAADLEYGRKVGAGIGAFVLTGTAATLTKGKVLNAEAGSFAVTGTDADLEYGRKLPAESGSFAVSGIAADLEYGRKLGAGSGSFVLTGTDADLIWSGETATYVLTADAGAFVLTGYTADLELGRKLSAGAGSFVVTGTDAALGRGFRLHAYPGAFVFVGQDVLLQRGRTLDSAAGSFSLSGQAATFPRIYVLAADPGTFVLTGSAAELQYSAARSLNAESGSFVVAGTDADLKRGYVVNASAGAYVLTGFDVTLSKGAHYILAADPGAFVLTGTDAGYSYGYVLTAEGGAFVIIGGSVDFVHTSILSDFNIIFEFDKLKLRYAVGV